MIKGTIKALVLLSGGIDSTTALAMAIEKHGKEAVMALNIYYGQKHSIELERAQAVAAHYGVPVVVEDLSAIFKFDKSSALLNGSDAAIPLTTYAEQLNELGGSGTVITYVPYRNGLFLSYAAAVALQFGAQEVWYGAHADDAAGRAYPDCTEAFIRAQADAIEEGTAYKVSLRAPFWFMTKKDIISEGIRLMAPYKLTWSCYVGGEKPCGVCGTCRDRVAAFEANGLEDPLLKI